MIKSSIFNTRFGISLAALVLVACTGITAPPLPGGVRVQVQVSGGIAGVAYSFEVSGRDGVVRGLTCTNGCDFTEGEVLLPLSVVQIQDLAQRIEDTGILNMDGTNFGSQCCDQFEFVVVYETGEESATVEGSSELFPTDLRAVVFTLVAMSDGILPVVVDLDGNLNGLPRDGVSLGPVTVTGNRLDAELSFGGGCALHEIDLVAVGGWLESTPVQVNLFFSHEDNDDPCDAFLTEVRDFDLRGLADEYEATYGVATPGETTLILRVEDFAEPNGARLVNYVF